MSGEPVSPAPEAQYFRTFRAGEVIFTQGEPGDLMYVIEEGEVEIVHRAEEGAPEERLAVLQHGDFFGEMAVLEGEPRTASARARTECRVLPVSGATFGKILRNNPEISVRMMRKLCGRLRSVEERLRQMQLAQLAAGGAAPESPPPPVPAPPPLAGGRLVDRASGLELPLPSKPDLTVGRPDQAAGTVPDVDLSQLNRDRTVSRRHARILRREGRLWVYEEPGTTNGTWVNGERVASATPVELSAGDELGFGSVRLVLHDD
ncbi:MAG TPA: cyclic nucleotide-binding domain-containing protein [Thermoanaerobaculia bacterium]|nr:cyclic nucleotide-binding domain-containing protein [Thermoanaerobaculia bacterium]